MPDNFSITIIDEVLEFIGKLHTKEQNKISGAINLLSNKKFNEVYVKQLVSNIKELRIKRYRLLFFIHKNEAFFIRIFIKKSNKTPKIEIELALKFYKSFIQFNKNI